VDAGFAGPAPCGDPDVSMLSGCNVAAAMGNGLIQQPGADRVGSVRRRGGRGGK
jgi:hypothetical protein